MRNGFLDIFGDEERRKKEALLAEQIQKQEEQTAGMEVMLTNMRSMLEAKVTEEHSKNEALRAEINELKLHVKEVQASYVEATDQLEMTQVELLVQVNKLSDDLALERQESEQAAQLMAERTTALEVQKAGLEREKAELLKQKGLIAGEVGNLTRKVMKEQDEKAQLMEKTKVLEVSKEQLAERIQAKQAQIVQLEAQMAQQIAQVTEEQAERAKAAERLAEAEEDKAKLQEALVRQEDNLAELTAERAEFKLRERELLGELETSANENDALQEQLAALKSEVTSLEEQVRMYKEGIKEVEDERAGFLGTIMMQNARNNELESKVGNMDDDKVLEVMQENQELKESFAQSERMQKQLQAELSDMRRQNQEASEQLESSEQRSVMGAYERQRLRQECEEAVAAKEQARREVEELLEAHGLRLEPEEKGSSRFKGRLVSIGNHTPREQAMAEDLQRVIAENKKLKADLRSLQHELFQVLEAMDADEGLADKQARLAKKVRAMQTS